MRFGRRPAARNRSTVRLRAIVWSHAASDPTRGSKSSARFQSARNVSWTTSSATWRSDVNRLADVGGQLMVSPNVEPDVISTAAAKGMVTMPGVFTPTEALAAARAGATGLKFFPASVLGPAGINAIRAILPADLEIAAVGGVSEKNFADYAAIGIRSFGLGSSLYKPGMTGAEARARAVAAIEAYDVVYGANR